MKNCAFSTRHRHGTRSFTLIELLVVIAIIGVLAALLSPGLKAARDKGRQIACMNNLRQIALGVLMYGQENNGYYPYGYGGGAWLEWDCVVAKYAGEPKIPYRVYSCPASAKLPCSYGEDWLIPTVGRRSYWVNANICPSYPADGRAPLKLGDIANPSGKILAADGPETHVGAASGFYFSGGTASFPIEPRQRHSGGLSVLFVDQHIQWMKSFDQPTYVDIP